MTAIIVTLLLIVIGGFIAFAIYLQMKEQARIERLRKVALLNNQLRQVRRYLDELPAQYQPKDMRLWLYSRMISICDELLKLQPDEPLSRRRRFLYEEMTQFQESKEKRRAKPVVDEVQIMELKRLFESFHTFLQSEKSNKHIPEDSFARFDELVHWYKYKVTADHHAFSARQYFLTHKMDNAISEYTQAINHLKAIEENPEAAAMIKQYQETIAEIEDDLALQQREAELEAEAQEDEQAEEELNDEWQKFMSGDDFQKKKHY